MFEGMNEEQARKEILGMVAGYCDKFHANKEAFVPGERIGYAGRVYDSEEMCSLVDASLEFWLTSGHYTTQFEEELGKYLNVKYVSLVNSGSSANLAAFMALTSPLLKERQVKRGDEVITVAAGFPTTVTPILQYGAVPVFVDVTIPEYNINVNLLEEARSEKTKAVMIAHTLGNPFDLRAVKNFCDKYGLWLIEDNCDALGSEYAMSRKANGEYEYSFTGTVGDIGTSSFYPPHHMTMGEGGAVYTDNPLLHRIVRSMRDWGRECICPSGKDNLCGHRFDGQFGLLPKGYDHKYVYSHFGYNLKATDLQAAVGCAQLKKLPEFTRLRREHFDFLKKELADLSDVLILPECADEARPSWFGFMMTCRKSGMREKVVRYLEENGIQTRMLFSGNIIKHPCFDAIRNEPGTYRVVGNLAVTDRIMEDTFWIGVYPGMTEDKLKYMSEKLHEAVTL